MFAGVFASSRKARETLGAALLIAATVAALALQGWACGNGGINSRAIEFCTPLASEPGDVPQVAVVVDPGPEPPLGEEARSFLVATELPITTIDSTAYAEIAGLDAPFEDSPVLREISLAVVDNQSTLPNPPEAPVVGRAEFTNVRSFITPIPPIGVEGSTTAYGGVVGGDLLRRYAVRLYYGEDPECILPWAPNERFPTIKLIREYADNNKELARDGFSVWSFRLAGGGRYMLDGKEYNFSSTRVGVSACVEPAPFNPADLDPETVSSLDELTDLIPPSGTNAFLLVATGTIPIVFGESSFKRVHPQWEPSYAARLQTLQGRITADATRIERIALLGSVSDDRSPCLELAHRRRIHWIRYWKDPAEWRDGAFTINSLGAPAAVLDTQRTTSATPIRLDAYVVPDTSKLLQGLRFETTPTIPQIDGLVGHQFLSQFETVIDYPGSRVLFRCSDYQPPGEEGCPPAEELQGGSCCEPNGRCVCHSSSPCCQLPRTLKP